MLPYNIMDRGFKFWHRMSSARQLSYELAAATFSKRASQSIAEPLNATDVKISEPTNADRSARLPDSSVEPVFVARSLASNGVHEGDEIHGGDKIHGGDEGRPHLVIQLAIPLARKLFASEIFNPAVHRMTCRGDRYGGSEARGIG